MSDFNFGDYLISSDDEYKQVQPHQYSETFTADQRNEEDDLNLNIDASVSAVSSGHESDEGDDSNSNPDIDEYDSFNTDLEKYQYDQAKWDGMQNVRKYHIVKKKNKAEGTKQTKAKNKDKPQQDTEHTTKRAKQGKPKALPKSKGKRKSKAEAPLAPAADNQIDGEIHFDARENLWYSYKKDGIYISERATYHHWIRADLSRSENAKGTYAFGRQRGAGNYDTTCFNEVEQAWGLQRSNYAPVLFEWERLNRADPTYALNALYHQGLLVIDYWKTPVRCFVELPLVISSAFEGGFIEPATRLHSEMTYEDIRARMPPFVQIIRSGTTSIKALSKASTLSGRARHFREEAGAISWDRREGSNNIKSFIEEIVKPVLNSTYGSRNLTKDEVKRLRLSNFGTKPGRSKQGTSKASKKRYKDSIEKAAGLTPTEKQEVEDEDGTMMTAEGEGHEELTGNRRDPGYTDSHEDLYNDPGNQLRDEPMASVEENNYQGGSSTLADVSDRAARRLLFRCTGAPCLRALTQEEALMDPTVDTADPRNHVPKLSVEVDAVRDALKVTVDHFKQCLGFEPQMYEGANYISEYCNIQDQLDDIVGDEATALRRLGRWEGTIVDWEQAQVEDEPCVGRRRRHHLLPFLAASADF